MKAITKERKESKGKDRASRKHSPWFCFFEYLALFTVLRTCG